TYSIVSSSLSILIILRSPASTLFPYTTLFRSRGTLIADHAQSPVPASQAASCQASTSRLCDSAPHPAQHRRAPHVHVREHASRVDRKSTRLNSSHRTISYAVFCLKKKKLTSCY